MELRRAQRRHAPYRALLWSGVILLGVLMYLQDSPWEIEAEGKPREGIEISREAQADVVVVLDYQAIQRSGDTFSTRDWSVSWINMFEQEIGPVTIATPQSLSHKVLSDARVVVMTASVTRDMTSSLLSQLKDHASQGNVLVLERPRGEARATLAADGRAGSRRAQKITFAREMIEPYQTQMTQMPMSTEFIGSTNPRPGATTWLAIDGAPAIYSVPLGDGHVVTVDFDLGEQLVALQQGRPREDFTLPERPGAAHARLTDLLWDERQRGAKVPWADLLERFIVHRVLGTFAPIPSLWLYPGGAMGVVIGAHEDNQLGDGGGWMLRHEVEHKSVSTLLVTAQAGITAAGAAAVHRMGGDIGLSWKLPGTPGAPTERLGMGDIEPLVRPLTLSHQLDDLKETLPVNYVRSSRVHGGWWMREWAGPFRHLAGQKLRIDMSYEVPDQSGYAFGTGLPFLALDRTGMPLGIRELPIVVPERREGGPSIKELLEASQEGHHMALTISHAPAAFADYPEMDKFNEWLTMFEELQRTGHRMTSASRFDAFLRGRRASSLRSRLVSNVRMPVKQPPPSKKGKKKKKPAPSPEPQGERVTVMRVTVEAKGRGMWLMIPGKVRGGMFLKARQRTKRVGSELVSAEIEGDKVHLVGIEMRRIPLEQGFNTIDVYYQPEVSP